MNNMIKIAGVLVAVSMLAITLEACDEDTNKSTPAKPKTTPQYQIRTTVSPDTDTNSLTGVLGTSAMQSTGIIQDNNIKIIVVAKQINIPTTSDLTLNSEIKGTLPAGLSMKSGTPECTGMTCTLRINTKNYESCEDAVINISSTIGNQKIDSVVEIPFDKSKPWFVVNAKNITDMQGEASLLLNQPVKVQLSSLFYSVPDTLAKSSAINLKLSTNQNNAMVFIPLDAERGGMDKQPTSNPVIMEDLTSPNSGYVNLKNYATCTAYKFDGSEENAKLVALNNNQTHEDKIANIDLSLVTDSSKINTIEKNIIKAINLSPYPNAENTCEKRQLYSVTDGYLEPSSKTSISDSINKYYPPQGKNPTTGTKTVPISNFVHSYYLNVQYRNLLNLTKDKDSSWCNSEKSEQHKEIRSALCQTMGKPGNRQLAIYIPKETSETKKPPGGWPVILVTDIQGFMIDPTLNSNYYKEYAMKPNMLTFNLVRSGFAVVGVEPAYANWWFYTDGSFSESITNPEKFNIYPSEYGFDMEVINKVVSLIDSLGNNNMNIEAAVDSTNQKTQCSDQKSFNEASDNYTNGTCISISPTAEEIPKSFYSNSPLLDRTNIFIHGYSAGAYMASRTLNEIQGWKDRNNPKIGIPISNNIEIKGLILIAGGSYQCFDNLQTKCQNNQTEQYYDSDISKYREHPPTILTQMYIDTSQGVNSTFTYYNTLRKYRVQSNKLSTTSSIATPPNIIPGHWYFVESITPIINFVQKNTCVKK